MQLAADSFWRNELLLRVFTTPHLHKIYLSSLKGQPLINCNISGFDDSLIAHLIHNPLGFIGFNLFSLRLQTSFIE